MSKTRLGFRDNKKKLNKIKFYKNPGIHDHCPGNMA